MTEVKGMSMSELDEAWQVVGRKAAEMARMDAFPLWTEGTAWVTAAVTEPDRGILPHDGSWMVGDLPGLLWCVADDRDTSTSGPEVTTDTALGWSRRLENRATVRSFASVSHLFYRGGLVPMLTHGATALRQMMVTAATTISNRFRAIGYMKSFGTPEDGQYPFTTIDDVINLCVPLWYANETGDEELAAALVRAADLIGDRLVRPDGSVIQVLRFDSEGRPTRADTYQGESVDGCWSRGLAWGIYGFAQLAGLSHSPRHLEWAQCMTDYWMDRVQGDSAPVWDFAVPTTPDTPRDTFAATLGYAGILELAARSSDDRSVLLHDYARASLEDLSRRYVLEHHGLGIVRGAALDVPRQHGVGHDAAVIVGDSYFAEALWQLRRSRRGNPLLPAMDMHRDAKALI